MKKKLDRRSRFDTEGLEAAGKEYGLGRRRPQHNPPPRCPKLEWAYLDHRDEWRAISAAADAEGTDYVIIETNNSMFMVLGNEELGIDAEDAEHPKHETLAEAQAWCQQREDELWTGRLLREDRYR